MQPTKPLQALATHLLQRPVGEFLEERRANRDSWRSILRDLRDATDGQIDTTEVTARTWHKEYLRHQKEAEQGSAA